MRRRRPKLERIRFRVFDERVREALLEMMNEHPFRPSGSPPLLPATATDVEDQLTAALRNAEPLNSPLSSFVLERTTTGLSLRQLQAAERPGQPGAYREIPLALLVAMAQAPHQELISQSQAKQVLTCLERFREVILDFQAVEAIGPAFADEIFRVFVRAHPEVSLRVVNAVPDVLQRIRRAQAHERADA